MNLGKNWMTVSVKTVLLHTFESPLFSDNYQNFVIVQVDCGSVPPANP